MIYAKRFVIVLVGSMLASCQPSSQESAGPKYGSAPIPSTETVYQLAVHPLFNPTKLVQTYQPLIDYLTTQIPDVRFQLEASRDYPAFEAKFREREPEFLLPNPLQTLQAIDAGYSVIAMAGDAADFKGILIVRRDSPIRTPADLKGKILSCPAKTALAACIMPQYFLHTHGVDMRHDVESRYVGSQDSAIMNVYLKQSDIASTWPPPWRAFQKDHPSEAAQLKVIWETAPLVNNSVMVRDDVPAEVRTRVREVLLSLEKTEQGRLVLAAANTSRFTAANSATYQPARDFITHFENEVRRIDAP